MPLIAYSAFYSGVLKLEKAKRGQEGLTIGLQIIQPPNSTFIYAAPESKKAQGG